MSYEIYFYSKCSTCRKTKDLLDKLGIEANFHHYFENGLSLENLKDLLLKLQMKPSEFIRKKDEFHALGLENASEDELLMAMSKNSKLIQRPILVKGDKAVLCRPPEKALELINV